MPINKLLSILDPSEPIRKAKAIRDIRKENFNASKTLEDIEPPFYWNDKTIRDIRRENCDADKILKDKRTLFESDEEDYYKPLRTGNAFNSNYIEYEGNGDKNKSLSIKKYLDQIKSFLSHVINEHKTEGEWKIHLIMAINFMSSKDSN